MKRLLLVILSFMLVSCNSVKSRTEVIDTLIDNGFAKNAAGAYERNDGEKALRLKYYETPEGYSESAYRYLEKGPVLIMDFGSFNFNYHFNEDLIYYPTACGLEDGSKGTTEIVYRFETSEFILTHDDCNFDTSSEKVNEFYVEATNYKNQALEVINNLGLSIEDLNNLGLD